MNEQAKAFLSALADLLEQYRATIFYTTDDDGLHIDMDGGTEVFVGFLSDTEELRQALKKSEEDSASRTPRD